MNDQPKFSLGGFELPPHTFTNQNLQEELEAVLATERQIGEGLAGPGFVNYLEIYDRPENLGLMPYQYVRVGNVEELFNAVKNLWTEDAQYLELNDYYWDALSIYRQSEQQTRRKFPAFFRNLFLKADAYMEQDPEGKALDARTRTLAKLIRYLSDHLFSDGDPTMSMFSLSDADNENTSFAPYVFYGNSVIVVVGKKWIL
jgi:hypothetical protein